ncbi:MAG: prephenate dehydrogenase [Oscillospiraceae bacterium]
MNIGIVGLGLIGGSIAKAICRNTSHTVMGVDIDNTIVQKARLLEAIDLELNEDRVKICDILIIALYPKDIVKWVTDNADNFKTGCIVMDCGGVKSYICNELMPLAQQKSFCFIGAHPMAGLEKSGFDNARGSMFENASIILTPPKGIDIEKLCELKKFWGSIGFTNVEITSPEEHDRRIAFTSQLAHVVSSAYVKSSTALTQHGFSAGSYKDMTRVARLNEKMWAELFLENRDFLSSEIETIIDNLIQYKKAIDDDDFDALKQLLKEGRECKEEADKGDIK